MNERLVSTPYVGDETMICVCNRGPHDGESHSPKCVFANIDWSVVGANPQPGFEDTLIPGLVLDDEPDVGQARSAIGVGMVPGEIPGRLSRGGLRRETPAPIAPLEGHA